MNFQLVDLCLDLYFCAMGEALAPKSLQIYFLEVLILVHINLNVWKLGHDKQW